MNPLIHTRESGERVVRLTPGKRVLFLTKDPETIRAQLRGELDLSMADVDPADLLDDINTDTMTPAWVCFRHKPEDLALDAYAGLLDEAGERVFPTRALLDGGFEVIVSGQRKGTGSSRETAPQAEKWSGIHLVIAHSFAPIHERNNINLGQLMGGYDLLQRLQAGEELPLEAFTSEYDPVTRVMLESGLFPFASQYRAGEVEVPLPATEPRPMTMGEKILASKLVGADGARSVRPGDVCLVNVDGGYSHEFTTAQVHHFLGLEYGDDYRVVNPDKFAIFEDHLLYATGVERMKPFEHQIQTLRDLQNAFQAHTGVRDYSATDGVSPGICHEVAREEFVDPGDFIQATDSHTCMGGGSNALTWGVGATEYAGLIHSGFTFVEVPESIRFELVGELDPGCTAKDVILEILDTYAKREDTLNRVMEFGGPGLASLSPDERATLCNMATECSARSGICEGDERLAEWVAARREGLSVADVAAGFVAPDPEAEYAGGVHTIDLGAIRPMVAEPGDPTYGKDVADLEPVRIDIAYGGLLHGGQGGRLRVLRARAPGGARQRPPSRAGRAHVRAVRLRGRPRLRARQGLRRDLRGRGRGGHRPRLWSLHRLWPRRLGLEGPGHGQRDQPQLQRAQWPREALPRLALTVAASAVMGTISAYRPGMFAEAMATADA